MKCLFNIYYNYLATKLENPDEDSEIVKSLKLFCLNFGKLIYLFLFISNFQKFILDPLASGLRRRAQSLNFAIRSNQPSVDNTRQDLSTSPSVKRQRK